MLLVALIIREIANVAVDADCEKFTRASMNLLSRLLYFLCYYNVNSSALQTTDKT